MLHSRVRRMLSAFMGSLMLAAGSLGSAHAQIPPGTINLPWTITIPPESVLPLSDLVTFNGAAVITSDNTNSALSGPCLGNEPDYPGAMDLVGCGGTFSSTSSACALVSDAEPDLPGAGVPEAGTCSAIFNAALDNFVCDTGMLQGCVTLSGGVLAHESAGGYFGIVLVATVGIMTGNLADGDYMVGVIQLGPPLSVPPPPSPNDVDDCTSGVSFIASDLMFDL